MTATDRNALWSSGRDESVEVNQRALIDKVLARYSGEFTVFRELLQNSDDAASGTVEICFESKIYLDRIGKDVDGDQITQLDLKQHVHQWTFRNNGIAFRGEDWSRLKKIAEGNPDEEKIGAFGVGFYSLFSVTEEPFVKSGNEWMGFYWKDKKDQLFVRRGTLPGADTTKPDPYREWTTFEMALREPAPIPSMLEFVRFLTSSITFMAHLKNVAVFLDGKCLAKISKSEGVPKELAVPKGLKSTSNGKIMSVTGVNSTSLNISAEVLHLVYTADSQKKSSSHAETRDSKVPIHTGFFSSLFSSLSGSNPVIPRTPSPLPLPDVESPDPMSAVTSHVVLSVFSGQVEVRLEQKMIAELHRSTKKNPPNKLRLELIYTGKDEYDASKHDEEVYQASSSVFQGLRADLDGTGSARVYIGHATGQTTGLGGHISGRFIPTVERESIDFVDRNVAVWNKELLYVAGLLARVAYEMEMDNVRNLWDGASESAGGHSALPEPELRNWLQNRAIHALKFFTLHPSTPSAVVSNLLETAFFSSSLDNSFPMISTVGVLDARNIRAFNPDYSGFIHQLPILPPDVASNAKLMVDALRSRGMIKDITFADVLTELRSRALTQEEMVECLKWRIKLNTDGIHPTYLAELRREFLGSAVFTIEENNQERIIPLSIITTVLIPRNAAASIPVDTPLPNHTLPFSLSKRLKSETLPTLFGWSELTIPVWLENLVSQNVQSGDPDLDMTKSAVFAEKILCVLARAWASISSDHQTQIVKSLNSKACIPTKFGMKIPQEAYFPNANIFPDLPIVTLPRNTVVKGPLEKVLTALGVLHHVDLQIVFSRMIRTGDWGIPDLIRYLVAVEDSLTSLEMTRLRETAAFPKEEPEQPTNQDQTATSNSATPQQRSASRYKAIELYEPSNALRELELPILAWGNSPRWRVSSEEAKFLFKLGLQRHPVLPKLLSLAAGPDPAIRRLALQYFFDNSSSKYPDYDPNFFSALAYIPAVRQDGVAVMGKPLEVFTDKEAGVMGFLVIDTSIPVDAIEKLKLRKSPPADLLLPILEKKPTRDPALARKWFEFLANRLRDFSPAELHRLSRTAFIPIATAPPHPASTGALSASSFLDPQKCYLGGDTKTGFHSKLFTFVDFGSRANVFLIACGVRKEPTVDELAKILVANPHNFYKLAGGLDKFLVELRNIAINYHSVSTPTRNQMKKSACLVGFRRVRIAPTPVQKRRKKSDGLSDDDEGQLEHDLLMPDKIVIVDDTTTHTLFDDIFSAPQEDILEEFYATLGSPRLSDLVREDYKPSADIPNSIRGSETRRLVLERLPLFLHERTNAKPLVSYSWLNNPDNFVVSEVGKLTLTRTLQFGTMKLVKTQEASATADRKGKGPVRLYISGNSQLDLYEVSNSLCRVLLRPHKPNDSLLFTSLLTTDLRALRRRGYNVDRIIRQQQAERDAHVAYEQQLISQEKQITSKVDSTQVSMNSQSNPGGRVGSGFLSNWRQRFHKPTTPDLPQLTSTSPPRSPPSPPKPTPIGKNGPPDPMKPYGRVPLWNSKQAVTPHAQIERNVRSAIEGCKAERNSFVRSNAQTTRIREAMDEGYCDTMGAIDLELVGNFGGIFNVFVTGQNDAKTMIQAKKDAISRFGDLVLQPLVDLYNIPSSSCNIFYDLQGPLIAFNRNGSLFLNLRYYEAWHDTDVQKGDVASAHISWYFSLAHEIAHNLVHPHNSEHEFYFSTICQQHLVKLAALVGQGSIHAM